MAYAWMLNFWFAPPLQSQVSIRTPEAVLEFGSSRQRPDLAFLKKNAPVWASAVIVQSWLGTPGLQSLMASCVPFPTELPNPARSTHLALLAVMVMCQLLPSGRRVNLCGVPLQLTYCGNGVP